MADEPTPERLAAWTEIRELRQRIHALDDDALDLVFRQARTHYAWTDRPVGRGTLERLYATIRNLPTATNGSPGRFVFVTTREAKDRLLPAVSPGNRPKVDAAPVTVIVAYDETFWTRLATLHPHKDQSERFRSDPEKARADSLCNGTLQGAYLLLAARALGLDTGPMSGFSNAAVDAEFFAGTAIRSNFLMNIGYADERGIFPRLPRLSFEEACSIL